MEKRNELLEEKLRLERKIKHLKLQHMVHYMAREDIMLQQRQIKKLELKLLRINEKLKVDVKEM